MSPAEVEQLTRELTESKLSEMVAGFSGRTGDQPVKVVPPSNPLPKSAAGYFTQQKSIWLKTPEEMEGILGVFGKFRDGAIVLQFTSGRDRTTTKTRRIAIYLMVRNTSQTQTRKCIYRRRNLSLSGGY